MAHSDIDPTNPPPRRLGAVVLVRDHQGRVLLVNPTYKDGWILPGGGAHADEPLAEAAARELKQETGLDRRLTHYLTVDQVPANTETESTEGINVVLDGGLLSEEEATRVSVPASSAEELAGVAWVDPAGLSGYVQPYQERRITEALDVSRRDAALPILLHGQRPAA